MCIGCYYNPENNPENNPEFTQENIQYYNIQIQNNVFNCSNCKKLTHLSYLPENINIYEIKLDNCVKLNRITVQLPSSLKELTCKYCINLEELPKLPDRLQHLDCTDCINLKDIPKLPKNLRGFYCTRSKITNLPTLPKKLQELCCSNNFHLKELPKIPDSIKILDISYCNIEKIPKLPKKMVYLRLSNNIQELPAELHALEYVYCYDMIHLPEIPRELNRLYIKSCTNLQDIPDDLPDTLVTIILSNLNIKKCPRLEHLNNLWNINIMSCNSMQLISKLPDSVDNIYLFNCEKLEGLYNIPVNNPMIRINDCMNLKFIQWDQWYKLCSYSQQPKKDIYKYIEIFIDDNYESYRKKLSKMVSDMVIEEFIKIDYIRNRFGQMQLI